MVWGLAFNKLTLKGKPVVPGGVLLVVPSGLTTSSMESAGLLFKQRTAYEMTRLLEFRCVLLRSVTVKVSSGSNAVSAHTSTVTGLLVSPGAKVSVPLWMGKSHLSLLLTLQFLIPTSL